ncbi:hypothetical protein CsatB_024558 [Cannabis sativa]|nr:uncharacterized protein LOC115714453 [Cannabis sativa]XP_030499029.1 uncharacterized protein LOC115714453 [Cannabis sativa]XP_030499030.1 uncharacterized protein LOC115714453 [Cannabis sativa]XP_030499031.1 uncharacterized protein LOC115714453 [Cannabis sativa]XP_060970547.1 uncharacterized protein LOC115714453 [Cannabis sativa]XP_060970548.1 uncharacterized protein LOC115714453 [Cannabis sativa]
MGSEACENLIENIVDLSTSSFGKMNEVSVVESQKDVEPPALPAVSEDTRSLGSITSDSDRENVDSPIACSSPPSTKNKITTRPCFDLDTDQNWESSVIDGYDDPVTPKSHLFNAFRPCPEDLVLAPRCRKFVNRSENLCVRKLSFDSSNDVSEEKCEEANAFFISDEEIINVVYENLLETIVSMQVEDVLARSSSFEWDSNDCKTPPSTLRVNEIADTCPKAPMRPPANSRKIGLALRRRLQFSP